MLDSFHVLIKAGLKILLDHLLIEATNTSAALLLRQLCGLKRPQIAVWFYIFLNIQKVK